MRRVLIPLCVALGVVVATALPAHAVTTTLRPSSGVSPTSGAVYSVVTIGPDVVIGGNFSAIVNTNGKTVAAGGLAALNTSTGAWVWSASPGGITYGLATDGTNVYAGGTYGMRSYSQSGAPQSFKAQLGVGVVHAVAFGNGRLFYGGDSGVVAATSTGAGVWRATGQGIRSLAVSGTQLLVGARYCTTGGGSAATLVSLNPDGTLNTSFNSHGFACNAGTGQPPLSIAISNGQAFVGGGGTLNRVYDINPTTGGTVWQSTHGDGDVQSVAVQGGQVYIGGHFDCVNGSDPPAVCLAPRLKIARYSLNGVLDPTWAPNLTAGFMGVWAMTGDATQLYVGGEFTRVNGAVRNKFAIFGST
jgi:Domain of unknown function (DUF5122) beta-propeller